MDEVLAVGDMKFQQKCLKKMREVAENEGRTVLYVSHNMNTIRQLCDRCIVLEKGKIIYNGAVEEAIQIYLGSKMNSESYIELASLKRDPEFSNHPITIQSLEAINNLKAIYDVGSFIHLQLNYKSLQDVKNAFLRVIVKTVEGTPVTMLTADKGIEIIKDSIETIAVQVDVTRLVPGRYALSLVFYEVNEFGGNVSLDGLKDVYCFEMVTVPGFNNNMEWQQRYWGNFYGEPLQVKKIVE